MPDVVGTINIGGKDVKLVVTSNHEFYEPIGIDDRKIMFFQDVYPRPHLINENIRDVSDTDINQ